MKARQLNLKMPERLADAAEEFARRYGYRNVQDLALDSLREKIFEKSRYDEAMEEEGIALIDELISRSLENGRLVEERELLSALRR